jgi:hypothetical protein
LDADRFDRIAKTLTTQPSRRRMLSTLASLALGGAVVSAGRDEAAADHCRAPGKPCRKGTQCCSGFCNKRRGKCKQCPQHFKWCEAQDGCIWETDCCDDEECSQGAIDMLCCDGECIEADCCTDDQCSDDEDQCIDGFCCNPDDEECG